MMSRRTWGSGIASCYFQVDLLNLRGGGGVRRNLTSSVLARLNFFNEGGVFGPSVDAGLGRIGGSGRERERGFDSEVARRASIKLGDGDIRGAMRLLCSQEGGVSPSPESAAQMKDKHPPPSGVFTFPSVSASNPFQVTGHEVFLALKSFAPGSAGGPDGVRPKHILDIIGGEGRRVTLPFFDQVCQ